MRRNEMMTNSSPNGTLVMRPAGADLAPHVLGFVHRDEYEGGQVVKVLPELRASIQIMIADPYWLRDRDSTASWSCLPRISLWAPKYDWCYGYAAKRIKAYAAGLTAAGLWALTGRPAAHLLNGVFPLERFSARLARALAPVPDEEFASWSTRAARDLREFFESAPRPAIDLEASVDILATGESGAVERAAALSGLSERQFRRVFEKYYGVAPKRFQRALRVDRMIRQLHPDPWEEDARADEPIAFADQPHAIREFQAMLAMTPAEYLRKKKSADRTLRSIAMSDIAPPDKAAR